MVFVLAIIIFERVSYLYVKVSIHPSTFIWRFWSERFKILRNIHINIYILQKTFGAAS